MERWEKWKPVSSKYSELFIEKIVSDTRGLFVHLKGINNKRVVIAFENTMYSEQVTKKKGFLKKMSEVEEKEGINFFKNWPFYKVKNSGYLKWIHDESYGLYERVLDKPLEHYVIVSRTLVFEVIAPNDPQIEINNIE